MLKVKEKYVVSGSAREQPSYRGLMTNVLEPEVVVDCVADTLGSDREKLLLRLGDGLARGIVSELLYRYSGLTQAEIGKLLGGIDHSAVSQLRRRLRKRMVNDRLVADRYAKIEKKVRKLLSSVKI